MSEQGENSPGVARRVASRTGRLAKGAGKLWMAVTLGDVRGELERKRAFYAWVKRRLTPAEGVAETFDQAVQRLGVSEEQLIERADSLRRMGLVYGVVAALAFLVLLASPLVARPLTQFLLAGGVMGMSGAKALVCHFRLYEIRHRTFVNFRDWLFGRT